MQDSVVRGWSWPPNQIFIHRQLPLACPDLLAQDTQSQWVLTLPSCELGMRGAEEFTQIPFYKEPSRLQVPHPVPHPHKCCPGLSLLALDTWREGMWHFPHTEYTG